MELLGERAFVSRATVRRVERGDPAVSMGIYATILFVLGLSDRLGSLVDSATDRMGLALEEERLPLRVRSPRARPEER